MQGLGASSLNIGASILVLKIWKGRNSGPYIHAMHFTFGFGAFIAPILSRPFLHNAKNVESDEVLTNSGYNQTSEMENIYQDEIWTIKTLYLIVGVYGILSSFGLVFCFIKDFKNGQTNYGNMNGDSSIRVPMETNLLSSKMKIFLVGIMALTFFFYVGMEMGFGMYISVFAVKSELKFTRPQG